VSIKIELTEQAEAQELHHDTADTGAVPEHQVLVPLGQVAELPYLELLHIEILVLALEVILQVEGQVALADLTEVPAVALEAVATALEEVVLAAVLIEVQEVALEVQAMDHHQDHLVLQEVAAETKIKHL